MKDIAMKINGLKAELDIKDCVKYLGLSANNKLLPHTHPSREYMGRNQSGTMITINNPEPHLLSSGFERELNRGVKNIVVEEDSVVKGVAIRYSQNKALEVAIMLRGESGVHRLYMLKPYVNSFRVFGWRMEFSPIIDDIQYGDFLEKGTVLAYTPGSLHGDFYSYGINADVLGLTTHMGAEDSVVISESFAKKAAYNLYPIRVLKADRNNIPLNLYGNNDHYKIVPDIGEYVHNLGIVAGTREFRNDVYGILFNKKDLQFPRTNYDKIIYAATPYEKLVDIEVLYTPTRGGLPKDILEQVLEYANDLKSFRDEIIGIYNRIIKNEPDAIFESYTQALLTNIMLINNNESKKNIDGGPLPELYIKMVSEATYELKKGSKITTELGMKAVVSDVLPDDRMPRDKYGRVVDIIMDTISPIHRMIPGSKIEGAMTAAIKLISKEVKNRVADGVKIDPKNISKENARKIVRKLSDGDVKKIFEFIKDFVAISESDYYEELKRTESISDMRKTIASVLVHGLIYPVPLYNKKRISDVAKDMMNHPYFTQFYEEDYIEIPLGNGHKTHSKTKMLIETLYILILYKIADTWLATNTPRINPLGAPMAVKGKNRQFYPYTDKGVKTTSEMEIRHQYGYNGRNEMIEIRDRDTSLSTQAYMYRTILNADKPTRIKNCAPRDKIELGHDNILTMIRAIFRTHGLDIGAKETKDVYSEDEVKQFIEQNKSRYIPKGEDNGNS